MANRVGLCGFALLAFLAAPRAVPAAEPPGPMGTSLTGMPGDAARGRAIVVNRQLGLCLLCHSGPFPEEPQQGNLAPSLAGAGARWSEAALRQRVVDARQLNPQSIMPAYHRTAGLEQVGRAWQGRPLLSAAQVEDVVAFLSTLRD